MLSHPTRNLGDGDEPAHIMNDTRAASFVIDDGIAAAVGAKRQGSAA